MLSPRSSMLGVCSGRNPPECHASQAAFCCASIYLVLRYNYCSCAAGLRHQTRGAAPLEVLCIPARSLLLSLFV